MTPVSRKSTPNGRKIRLGVLGGGQLVGMMLPYAEKCGAEIWVMDSADAPARNQAGCARFLVGDITNLDDVMDFGLDCDVLTIEIEKVNCEALAELEKCCGKSIRPGASVVATVQDKGLQKQFFRDHGIPTADFRLTKTAAEVEAHTDFLPAAHKLRRGGYDGKGVVLLNSAADLKKAFDAPAVLEKKVALTMEISVIVARGADGTMRTYAPVEMVFDPRLNLLDYLIAPANLSGETAKKADALARKVAEKLGVTGLLAVEMFLTPEGELLVNEVAPRPHNSGHHTIESAATSQFEQHLRAVLGLKLGDTQESGYALMLNLVGEPGHHGRPRFQGRAEAEKIPGVVVHDYGKLETRPGRKMGHVTITGTSRDEVKAKAVRVKALVHVVAD